MRCCHWLKTTVGALALVAMIGVCGIALAQTAPATRKERATPAGRTPAAKSPQTASSGAGVNRFGLAEPPKRTPGSIRIGAYNLLNLFDHVDDPNLQGEFDDIKTPTAIERCAKLAEAIRTLDADIIALSEVESLEALTWFRDTFLKDAGYKYLASKDVGYYRGVECSVMSRHKITSQRVWLNESLDHVKRDGLGWDPVPGGEKLVFQRSPLMVEIEVSPGYKLTVLAVHHKAGPKFKYHREAEALRIVEIIEELRKAEPQRNIVVMGDFNAAPWDKSVRTYLKGGMVDAMAYRTTGKDDPESPLYKTHESDRVLDYILLNSAALREYVPGTGFVLGTLTPPPSYNYERDPHPVGYASDHYPVAIDLIPRDQ